MHDALPDSISAGHSMNEFPAGTESSLRGYSDLVAFRRRSSKEVQVLASYSHFLMSDVYQTACYKAGDVLPGWIVGTAGATRYRLPVDHAAARIATMDVYGYLLGTVSPEGHVSFGFKRSRHQTCLKRLVPDSDRSSSGSASRKTRTAM